MVTTVLSSRAQSNGTRQEQALDKKNDTTTTSTESLLINSTAPMTIMERTKRFPVAVQQLYKDWMLYRNIEDASRTPLNAWTVNHPLHKPAEIDTMLLTSNTTHVGLISLTNDTIPRPGRIPRRQLEHQRRLRQDLAVVSPLVLVWLLPIIGYLPMILAFIAPRQVLSRHFWNDYEIHYYRQIELEQRRFVYSRLAELFLQVTASTASPLMPTVVGDDAFGPLLDVMPLSKVFTSSKDRVDSPMAQLDHRAIACSAAEAFSLDAAS